MTTTTTTNDSRRQQQQAAASRTRSRQAQRAQRNGMNAFGYCVPLLPLSFHGKKRRVELFVSVVVVVMILNLKQNIQLSQQVIPKQEVWIFLGIDDSSSNSTDDDDGNSKYLTKPDTILPTRPDAMSVLSQQLVEDKIWASRRLQPIPHEKIETLHESKIETVNFIPKPSIRRKLDCFSASWWQSKDRFLRTFNASDINGVEMAAFHAIIPYRHELRMTSDWLKFSVEHMSKAWKISGFEAQNETQSYRMYVEKFLDYIDRTFSSINDNGNNNKERNDISKTIDRQHHQTSSPSPSTAMLRTIAVIPFIPYRSTENETRGKVLTTTSLGATLMSLIRLSCGRVVVVVDQKDFDDVSASIMEATKQLLQDHQSKVVLHRRRGLESFFNKLKLYSIDPVLAVVNQANMFEYRVHQTQIGLVVVNCTEDDGTKFRWTRNVPKAALLGLKKAFEATDLLHTRQWLGHSTSRNYKDKWNYTYLTEPDSILHARDQALPAFTRELENGNIVVPHRLQPIPHENDLPDYNFPGRVLPAQGNFSIVESLGSDAMCCDDGPSAPGWVKNKVCGATWWECGFIGEEERRRNRRNRSERHFRLRDYQFMELQAGTRIVSLAGTNHGRRCVPKQRTGMDDQDCPSVYVNVR